MGFPDGLRSAPGRVEIGLDDRRVAVAPLCVDHAGAVSGAEIDQRVGSAVDRSSNGMLRARCGSRVIAMVMSVMTESVRDLT